MWANIFTLAVRLMHKHRLFFMINLIGLALGLMAVVMIITYVRDQRSYDAWVPGAERVWRVGYHRPAGSGSSFTSDNAPGVIVPALREALPDMQAAVRAVRSTSRFRRGDDYFDVQQMRSEPDFFRVFKPRSIAGDPVAALAERSSVVLTRSIAQRFFGRLDILGETITSARGETLTVAAVIEDWPEKSHFRLRMIRGLFEADFPDSGWMFRGWQAASMSVYVKFADKRDKQAVASTLNKIYSDNVEADSDGIIPRLVPVSLRDVFVDGREPVLGAMLALAVFILLIAGINFINLTLSRLSQREREVAVRRVVGASRGQVVLQFLAEGVLTTTCALIIGMALAEILLPTFNDLMQADMSFNFVTDPTLQLICIGLILIIGLGASAIPAWMMARLAPADALANGREQETPMLRRLAGPLVVLQFAMAIGLITATVVLHRQTIYAMTRDPGFETHQRLAVMVDSTNQRKMRDLFATVDGVENIASGFTLPGRTEQLSADLTAADGTLADTVHMAVAPGYLNFLGVKPLAGRLLQQDRTADWVTISADTPDVIMPAVINDLTRENLGFRDAASAVGQIITTNFAGDDVSVRVIGVVPNLAMRSTRHERRPLIFVHVPQLNRFVLMKYSGRNMADMRADITALWNKTLPDQRLQVFNLDDVLVRFYAEDRRQTLLFVGFSSFAILIAVLGLYGLSSMNTERRAREIGIRKVLGAGVADIVRLLVWQFTRPVIWANLIAWPLAYWFISDWLNQFVDRIQLTPFPFVVAGITAFVIAAVTVGGQAARVAGRNPIIALRQD